MHPPPAGRKTRISLLDKDNKTTKDTYTIARVAHENSPENPLFVGKESENLKFGEWSMDLDAVTNLVATWNANNSQMSANKLRLGAASQKTAYAMVLFGGSMWCKDCANSEKHLFKSAAFKDWAKASNIALGVVDIPNLPNGTNSPCLLTTISVANATDRDYYLITQRPRSSGLGYLTRHMISTNAALEVYKRNLSLASRNVLNGGWNRPPLERANQSRPGVPIILLLRGDGTIAGRFTALASVSPTSAANNSAYIKRLNELIEQDKDPAEESNDGIETTSLETSRAKPFSTTASVSCTDERDIVRIGADAAGWWLRVELVSPKGAVANTDAVLECSVVSSSGAVMATAKGAVGGKGVRLDYKVPVSGQYFIRVKKDASPLSDAVNSASTVVDYSMSTDFMLKPEESLNECQSFKNGETKVKIELEAGMKYRFHGTVNANASYLEVVGEHPAGDKIYRAKVSGIREFEIASKPVKYQKWNGGFVGFGAKTATVSEATGQYDILVARTGGVSGTAKYRIKYDGAFRNGDPCDFDRDTLLKADWNLDEGTVFTWGDGENDVKKATVIVVDNQFADGTVSYRFIGERIDGDADENEEMKTFILKVMDNDRKVPGVLVISDDAPKFSKAMTITAKESSTVSLLVKREGGADGDFSAELKTSAGQFVGGVARMTHDWSSRDDRPWRVELTLPKRTVAKSVTVELSPATSATKVRSSAKRLTVTILPGTVPDFENVNCTVDAFRSVNLSAKVAKAKAGTYSNKANLKFRKVSGALPSGLSAIPDAENPDELRVVGTPTKKGTSTAVYRIYDDDVGGTTVSITVAVGDPTKDKFYAADAGSGTKRPVVPNPAMAVGKTYYDTLVKDGGHLVGLVTLSLPASGKASAKYRSMFGTVSLSSRSWCGFNAATGDVEASLVGTGAAAGYRLYVKMNSKGNVTKIELTDPSVGKTYSDLEVFDGWSKAKPATDYRGYYTVSLPGAGSIGANNATQILAGSPLARGDGYMTLRMESAAALNQGKFAYAGMLPNGKAISGSAMVAALVPHAKELQKFWGVVPFVNVSDTDVFTGALKIYPKAVGIVNMAAFRSVCQYEGAKPRWQHAEVKYDAADEGRVCYDIELDAFGTYYNTKANFGSVTGKGVRFFAVGNLYGGAKYGNFNGANWNSSTLGVSVATTVDKNGVVTANTVKLANAKPAYALTLSFDSETGIVSGKFTLPTDKSGVTVNYKAIMLPGFGNSCDCGIVEADVKDRPFISGTAWFDDDGTFGYTYGPNKNKRKMLKVRRSCPVSVGTEAGK